LVTSLNPCRGVLPERLPSDFLTEITVDHSLATLSAIHKCTSPDATPEFTRLLAVENLGAVPA
jgi:hypothetical protein